MDRRIGTIPAHSKVLDELTTLVPGEHYALFETKQKALMFAAALGFYRSRPLKLVSRDAGAAIRFDIFEKAMDDGFVAALAVSASTDLNVLGDLEQECFANIFEEFANAGLAEIQVKVIGEAEPLQALIALMGEARFPQDETGLEGLDPSILIHLMGR